MPEDRRTNYAQIVLRTADKHDIVSLPQSAASGVRQADSSAITDTCMQRSS